MKKKAISLFRSGPNLHLNLTRAYPAKAPKDVAAKALRDAAIRLFSKPLNSCDLYCVNTVLNASKVGSKPNHGIYLGSGKIASCVLNAVVTIQSMGTKTIRDHKPSAV